MHNPNVQFIAALFLILPMPLLSKESPDSPQSKQELVKELHFWESMKIAQEKEYRELKRQNERMRLDQYEAMGLLKREPASTNGPPHQKPAFEKEFFKNLKHHLSTFENVSIFEDSGSIQVPLSSFGLFRHRLNELSQLEVKRLKPFLLKFAQTLKASEYWNHISGIEVKVHASPVYNQKFVSPETRFQPESQQAYLFNLKLTSKRAQEIAEVFYQPEFQKNQKLAELATNVRATGESFRNPVRKTRAPAGLEDSGVDCQRYHCQASRRLELSLIKKAPQ